MVIEKYGNHISQPIGRYLIANVTKATRILIRVAYAALADWDITTRMKLLVLSGESIETLFPQGMMEAAHIPLEHATDTVKRIAEERRRDLYEVVDAGYLQNPQARMLANVVWKSRQDIFQVCLMYVPLEVTNDI